MPAARRPRAAFVVKRSGPVLGEIEEDDREIKLRDGAAPIPVSEIEGEILRWPAGVRSLTVYGDVDENIRGGERRKALNALRERPDVSRGMRATGDPEELRPAGLALVRDPDDVRMRTRSRSRSRMLPPPSPRGGRGDPSVTVTLTVT